MKKKLKIAVNTRFLIEGKLEGIGTYTHQVLQRLVMQLPDVEFHFLFDRQWTSEYIYAENVKGHKLSPQARHPALWYWWFEKSVAKWLKNNHVDLFLSLDSFLSLKANTKTFLVMHDLAFEHYPEHVPFIVRKYYQYFFPKYATKSDHIFAVSNFTKQDLIKQYDIKQDKISIAYCGVSTVYRAFSKDEKIKFRKEKTNAKPYFICIGSLNPRKNIKRVVEAFSLLKKKESEKLKDYQLIIVGAKSWKTNVLLAEIEDSKFKKDIILLGHLKPEQLAQYLASSEALVFPSLFEGFGIPIIEGFSCNVPVITSNVSSMKEIGKDAALLVNPLSINSIENAMSKIISKEFSLESKHAIIEEKLKLYHWNQTVKTIKEKILLM